MAIWQYNCYLLPRKSICEALGGLPKAIEPETYDTRNWWSNMPAPEESEFSGLLARGSSWSNSIRTWGASDGDRIDLCFDEGQLYELVIRIDVRNISNRFVRGVLQIARRHDYVFRTEEGILLEPDSQILFQDIAKSSAFRFVRDPRDFLEQLDLQEPDQ